MVGRIIPYASLVDFVVLCSLGGLFLLILSLIADMQVRQRRLQEEALYYVKRTYFNQIKKNINAQEKIIESSSINEQAVIMRKQDENS